MFCRFQFFKSVSFLTVTTDDVRKTTRAFSLMRIRADMNVTPLLGLHGEQSDLAVELGAPFFSFLIYSGQNAVPDGQTTPCWNSDIEHGICESLTNRRKLWRIRAKWNSWFLDKDIHVGFWSSWIGSYQAKLRSRWMSFWQCILRMASIFEEYMRKTCFFLFSIVSSVWIMRMRNLHWPGGQLHFEDFEPKVRLLPNGRRSRNFWMVVVDAGGDSFTEKCGSGSSLRGAGQPSARVVMCEERPLRRD